MIGTDVEGLSESSIVDQLDAKGAGLGDYTSKFQLQQTLEACDLCTVQIQARQYPTQSNSSFSITQLFLSLISKTFE